MEEKISMEEKLMSLLSHLSILIPNIGILAPIIIWVTNKDKSRFVKFNALQAIFFQLIFFILMMFFIFIGVILMLVAIPWFDLSSNTEPGILFFLSMVFMFMYFPLWLIFGIYAVVASVKSFKGKIFKYAIIGRIFERKVY
ncbi:MAG: DUF4870 domain-containing protein [Actinobacteria bacterium]|nr:DUF4870 domain-containing protein [Actinomycetota bacterium]